MTGRIQGELRNAKGVRAARNQDPYREVDEKFLKRESGKGPIAKFLAKGSHGRVVGGKEAMDGFIRHMEGQCAPDEDPGQSEAARGEGPCKLDG